MEKSEIILIVRRFIYFFLADHSIIGLFLCIKSFPLFSDVEMQFASHLFPRRQMLETP